MAEAPKTVEPESNVQKAAVASDALEKPKGKSGETKPGKALLDVTKDEQERNDARKADKLDQDTYGTGLPPVQSAVDERVPVPVSTDAPKKDQEAAVARQSAGPREVSDAKTKITVDGKTVTVAGEASKVHAKLRDGGIVSFGTGDDAVIVNPAHVTKVESA